MAPCSRLVVAHVGRQRAQRVVVAEGERDPAGPRQVTGDACGSRGRLARRRARHEAAEPRSGSPRRSVRRWRRGRDRPRSAPSRPEARTTARRGRPRRRTPHSSRRRGSRSGSRRTRRRGRDVRPAARTLAPRRASSRRSRRPAPVVSGPVRESMNAIVAWSCWARARSSGSWSSGSAWARLVWARMELPAVRSAAAAPRNRLARWPWSGVSCAARASSAADAGAAPPASRAVRRPARDRRRPRHREIGLPRHDATPSGQDHAARRRRSPTRRGLDSDRCGWRPGRRPSE